METFMWAMVALVSLESLGWLAAMAMNDYPKRTGTHAAVNVLVNVGILIWALVILID
jgi:hypothetical protein